MYVLSSNDSFMSSKILTPTDGVKYHTTQLDPYDLAMKNRQLPKESLALNLSRLMERAGHSERDLAKEAKVSQKAVNNILNQRSVAKIDTVEKVASVYGVTSWQLIMPSLDIDMLVSGKLNALFTAFISTNPEGREYISQVADRESKLRAIESK